MQQGAIRPYSTLVIIEYNAGYVNIFFSILLCFFSVNAYFLPFFALTRAPCLRALYIVITAIIKKTFSPAGSYPLKRTLKLAKFTLIVAFFRVAYAVFLIPHFFVVPLMEYDS